MADEFAFGKITKKELEDLYRKSFIEEYEGYFNSIKGFRYHQENVFGYCNANASAIECEIVKIIGTVAGSKRSSIHINRNNGTVYVDGDSTIREGNLQYPRLSELLRIFRINTATEIGFIDEINNIISNSLNSHIENTYFRLKLEVAKELNCDLASAEKTIEKSGKRQYVSYSKNTTKKTNDIQKRLAEYEKLRKELDKLLDEFSSTKNEKVENAKDCISVYYNDITSTLIKINNTFKAELKPIYDDMVEYLGSDTANNIAYNACENVNSTTRNFFKTHIGIPIPPKPANHVEQKETHNYAPSAQMIQIDKKIPTYKKDRSSKSDWIDGLEETSHKDKTPKDGKKIALTTLAIIFFPITILFGIFFFPIKAIKKSSTGEGNITSALVWLGISIVICGGIWGLSYLNIFEAGSDWMFSLPEKFSSWVFESDWYMTVFDAFWALTLDNFFLIILLALPALVLILLLVVAELVLIVALIVFAILMFVFGFIFAIFPLSIGVLILVLATISYFQKDKDMATTIVYILTIASTVTFAILAML